MGRLGAFKSDKAENLHHEVDFNRMDRLHDYISSKWVCRRIWCLPKQEACLFAQQYWGEVSEHNRHGCKWMFYKEALEWKLQTSQQVASVGPFNQSHRNNQWRHFRAYSSCGDNLLMWVFCGWIVKASPLIKFYFRREQQDQKYQRHRLYSSQQNKISQPERQRMHRREFLISCNNRTHASKGHWKVRLRRTKR